MSQSWLWKIRVPCTKFAVEISGGFCKVDGLGGTGFGDALICTVSCFLFLQFLLLLAVSDDVLFGEKAGAMQFVMKLTVSNIHECKLKDMCNMGCLTLNRMQSHTFWE